MSFHKCQDFFLKIIKPYLDQKRKDINASPDQKALIIFDVFKGQWNDQIKRLYDENNCMIVPVPANLTNIYQPLDISINQMAKSELRKMYRDWYSDEVSNSKMAWNQPLFRCHWVSSS